MWLNPPNFRQVDITSNILRRSALQFSFKKNSNSKQTSVISYNNPGNSAITWVFGITEQGSFQSAEKRSKISHNGRNLFEAFKDCQMSAHLPFCHSLHTEAIPFLFYKNQTVLHHQKCSKNWNKINLLWILIKREGIRATFCWYLR